ncbi:MAG TPA: ABC transporter permease [Thermoanaerobaculia bacterium]|nr:ABC transporter permease [Thermoanaerobaculia bacterium]
MTLLSFYRLLLRLYPASFRSEYGAEMAAIFAASTAAADGWASRVALALRAGADVFPNAIRAHADVLRQDVRFSLRGLSRAPGFTATAIAVAAIGIGATTAAYSLLDRVLLRPLPFPEPERLVRVWQDQSFRGYRELEVSPPNYRDYKSMSHSFESMGATMSFSLNLVDGSAPRRLDVEGMTSEIFGMLGSRPLLGRLFGEADDRAGAPGTLVLSHALWAERFGADPSVIGRGVRLDDEPYTIVGVMPAGFSFPSRRAEAWAPMRFTEDDFQERTNFSLHVYARLRRGVSLEAARAEMSGIAGRLERAYPKDNAKTGVTLTPLQGNVPPQSRQLLGALFGAAVAVLLIACTNLASLLLARGVARRSELAVRAALGAGRERLLRQLLTESLILAFAGGALGVALAAAATPLAARLVPASLPVGGTPGVDLRVLLFAAALTVLTGIAFGVVPALRACGPRSEGLREGARAGASRSAGRLRAAFVVAQVTASVALLVACGLLLRALWSLQRVDPGFRADGVLTLGTALPMPRYMKENVRDAFYDRVLTDVRAMPGVSAAGFISFVPMTMGGGIWPIAVNGKESEAEETRTASLRFATPGLFDALGVPLRAGRPITDADTLRSPNVAVVSESFGRQVWPGEDPIGKHFFFAFDERTIVGVVGDVRVRGLERRSEPQVYLPHRQMGDDRLPFFAPKSLVVRSAVAPATLLPALREIVSRADPQIPVSDVRLLSDIVREDTAPRRAQARALAAFALVALALAGIGIHGLLAFSVSEREREIGVRVVLGAQPGEILRMIVRHGVRLAAAGVVLGAAAAYGAGRAMAALLAGISPADPAAFGTAAAIAIATALVGSLLPARRAVRLDPVRAIRSE